jgi:hypothetical protein
MWTYHAVAALVRAHSLLAAQPEVDRERIGITGISWGGYLTCITAGVDDRLKVAVPVYGCGFIHENSCWVPSRFSKMPEDQRELWVKLFDPSQYLGRVRCPILFVNGTTDFAYPLDSYQRSYRLVPGGADLSVQVGMKHGHGEGWSVPEIGWYVDSVLIGRDPLAKVRKPEVKNDELLANFRARVGVVKAQLHYTTNSGPWQKREWHTRDAVLDQSTARGQLPPARPAVAFLTLQDQRGAISSSEHVELPAPTAADASQP